jgi:triosephosphate isomerase
MKYIIANWKMNMNLSQVESWVDKFSELIPEEGFKNKVLLAGSYPYLAEILNFCLEYNLECCAQDVSTYEQGAHTGEVGAFQLSDFCKYCLVGHSERNEDKKTVLAKRDACLKFGLTPIVCFAQKEDWSNSNIEGALLAWEDPDNISQDGLYREKDSQDIVDAYEYFATEAPHLSIIYGGSVHKDNAPELAKITNLGGALIGNASLDPKHFLSIISAF